MARAARGQAPVIEYVMVPVAARKKREIDWNNPYTVPVGARRSSLIATSAPRVAFDVIDGAKVLPPIRPNAGLKADFKKRLLKLVRTMHKSTVYWISAAYKANEPVIIELGKDARRILDCPTGLGSPLISMDALPANALSKTTRELKRRWKKKFNEGADELARYFAQAVSARTDEQLSKILKDVGFSVEFAMTKAQRDVMKATVHESVSLIKSIPDQYFKNVEGAVMRSVAAGRDLSTLTKNLQDNYGVERRRAELIATQQNNNATAMLNKGRQQSGSIRRQASSLACPT
jgi:hypothetical protein